MSSFMKEFEHLKIQLEDIKRATNSFRNKNIGNGGFGVVYKGEAVTHSKGSNVVAIKRLDRRHGQGDPEFMKEIMMLSRYTHHNLISLLGYCDEAGEKILVYEYASNGSLDRRLSDLGLTWTQRLKICLGAAKGLLYLHDPNGGHQRVIHCDIKSANILLDENLNAKVADFGLAKIGPANQLNTFLITNPMGSHGYCDPLYLTTCTLTKESDVYSFGVVLFEVLCGRLCVEGNARELNVFVSWWKQRYIEKKLHEIIFQGLMQQMDLTSLEIFTDIAFKCLHDSSRERPEMSLVVKKLETALKIQERHDLKLLDPLNHRSVEELNMGKTVDEYQKIVEAPHPPLLYRSRPELRQRLSRGVLLNMGKTWFYLNDKDQHCEMISIADCFIPYANEVYSYTSRYDSRFPVGSLYKLTCDFRTRVRARFLSPNIIYQVNLIFRIHRDYDPYKTSKQCPIGLKYKVDGGETRISHVADKRKNNSWMVELCNFFSNGKTADYKFIFQASDQERLVIEGIEFQPVENIPRFAFAV